MKVMLAGAAVAAFTMAFGSAASATICTNQCDHSYSICNTMNGGNAQQICMPKWMQCKKACTAAVKPAAPVSRPSR